MHMGSEKYMEGSYQKNKEVYFGESMGQHTHMGFEQLTQRIFLDERDASFSETFP